VAITNILITAHGQTSQLAEYADSAFGALHTNDHKAELTIVVTVAIYRLAHKYAQMQHPLFACEGTLVACTTHPRIGGLGYAGHVSTGSRATRARTPPASTA
jgi:hypothetical protein